jgi:hypothetical protein
MPRNGTAGRGSRAAKAKTVDLGLDLLSIARIPGVPLLHQDIAAWCGCSASNIWLIQERAIHKLKKRLAYSRDPLLAELVRSVFDQPTPYYHARPHPQNY